MASESIPIKPYAFVVLLQSKGGTAPVELPALPFRAAFETDAYSGEVFYAAREMLTTSADGARLVVLGGVLYGGQTIGGVLTRGADGIADLNGSFALLWVDQACGEIVLATDRLNSVKLLASESGGRLAVSNAMDVHPLRGARLDPVGVASYLVNGFYTADRTPFAGVRMLEGGSIYRPRGGRLECQPYWHYLPVNTPITPEATARLRDPLEAAMIEATRIRLHGDRIPYLSLTSGYDSRSVLGVLAERLKTPGLRAFTYAYGNPTPDAEETGAARLAALAGYAHRTIQSFHGDAVHTLILSGRLGGGLADACDEVDAWLTLSAENAGQPRPLLFTGDSLMIRSDLDLRSNEDVLIAAHLLDFSAARWFEPFVGAARYRQWVEATRADLDRALSPFAPDDDRYVVRDRLRFQYRDGRQLMTWREYISGRFFEVVQPLMDTRVIELVMNAPLSLRRGKALYMHTVRQMFPALFAVPRAPVVTYRSYWPAAFRRQRADIRAWIEAQASLLDDVIEPSMLLALLDTDLTAHTRANARLRARAKTVYYFLQGIDPRLTALTSLTLVRPTVPADQLLKRALTLRAFLQSVQPRL